MIYVVVCVFTDDVMLLLFVLSGLIVKVMLRTGRKPSEVVRQNYKLTDYLIFPTLTELYTHKFH